MPSSQLGNFFSRIKLQFRRIHGWLAGAIALGLFGWGSLVYSQPPALTATVDYAKSGNTLELLFELSAEVPVTTLRLESIAAPDLQQEPWGPAARDCLADLRNAIIRVETQDWQPDSYGRLWAYVWQGKTLINQALLEQGCAYLASDRLAAGQHYSELVYAQEAARLLGRGIWEPAQPLRDSAETFRKQSPAPYTKDDSH